MWFSLSDQTAYFLWSFVFGAVLGALYDVLRAVRMLLKTKGAGVIVGDVIFFAVCGVLTSLFALPFNKGGVRAFIVFGEAVGFLLYRFTLGSVLGRVYSQLARILRCICKKLCKILEKIFNLLLKAVALMLYNTSVIVERLHISAKKHRHIRQKAAKAKTRRSQKHKVKHNEQKKIKKAKYICKNNRRSERRAGSG